MRNTITSIAIKEPYDDYLPKETHQTMCLKVKCEDYVPDAYDCDECPFDSETSYENWLAQGEVLGYNI